MKHLEIRTIEHKGIKVTIKIDYDKKEVSLVERGARGYWDTKAWHFGGRGLEYMNPWLNILEAMAVAIKEGKKELEHILAEDSKFKADMVQKVSKIIEKEKRKLK